MIRIVQRKWNRWEPVCLRYQAVPGTLRSGYRPSSGWGEHRSRRAGPQAGSPRVTDDQSRPMPVAYESCRVDVSCFRWSPRCWRRLVQSGGWRLFRTGDTEASSLLERRPVRRSTPRVSGNDFPRIATAVIWSFISFRSNAVSTRSLRCRCHAHGTDVRNADAVIRC